MEFEYKGYRLVPDYGNLLKVINSGKGMVPNALRGSFTSRGAAQQAVDDYLEEKALRDGKTNSNS